MSSLEMPSKVRVCFLFNAHRICIVKLCNILKRVVKEKNGYMNTLLYSKIFSSPFSSCFKSIYFLLI